MAISAAVALVVCVGVGFDSLRFSIERGIDQLLGSAELHVRPTQHGTNARFSLATLQTITRQPEVLHASGRLEAAVSLDFGNEHRWFSAIGTPNPAIDVNFRPREYSSGRALSGSPGEIVVDSSVADILKLQVGDSLTLSGDASVSLLVRVVGVVTHPQLEMLQRPTVYLPADALTAAAGIPLQFNVIDVKLREGVDLESFSKKLGKILGNSANIVSAAKRKAQFQRDTQVMNLALGVLATVAGICAALIIGTTLSVGVQERIRQFGQLRCIGASRAQLVACLAADAFLLILLGVPIGFLFGLLLSHLLVWYFPAFFIAWKFSLASVSIALGVGLLATLIGSLVPAWQISRITPMEAVRAAAVSTRHRHIWLAGAAGCAALALQQGLWWLLPGREPRFWTYAILGIPLIITGYSLLGPPFLLLFERLAAALVAKFLGVRPALLRHAWSRTPWRAGGMIAALMIGVTLFTAVRQRGHGLLNSWQFPTRFPDVVIYKLYGIPDTQANAFRKLPEVRELTEVATFPVKLSKPIFRIGSVFPEESTNFVCVNPAAFRTMVDMEFVHDPKDPNAGLSDQAYADQAYARLAQGNALFVSREFYLARGLGVGSIIPIQTPDRKTVNFTVAAVVTSTALDLAVNYFDARNLFQDVALSSVLGSIDDARKYFNLREINAMLVNVRRTTPGGHETADLRLRARNQGYQSASIVDIKDTLHYVISRAVSTMTIISVAALCVASLGVANMVIAAVHARRFEFGILRAIGAGRGQLVRLILAEITAVSLAAGLLGTAAGLHYAFMATQVDRLVIGFTSHFVASIDDLLNILLTLALSIAITITLGWLAALYPAWRSANTAQRALLAAGRA